MGELVRVFPRRTTQSPTDQGAFFNCPPPFYVQAEEVHISVAFTWDLPQAEWLEKQWRSVAPVKMGGPAFNEPSGEFMPGLYLKEGVTITSRGCNNRCWFCSVWKREPVVRELEIKDGWIVQDDNLLACSEQHIRSVFAMLKRQTNKVNFAGGLEAALLQPWQVDLLVDLMPDQMFFAYDTEEDYEPLVWASWMLREAGFERHRMRCYCLIGYPHDTMDQAEIRMKKCIELGFYPQAMLWKNNQGEEDPTWRRFSRLWARPAIIAARMGKND